MKVNQQSKIHFDYGSDLHIDHYYGNPDWKSIKNPDSDILILAGDNANWIYDSKAVINEAQKYYKHVLYVDGNHDNYNTHQTRLVTTENPYTVPEKVDFFSRHSKIEGWTYLSDTDFIVGDTVFIGNNGWYNWDAGKKTGISSAEQRMAWQRYIADSRFIAFNSNITMTEIRDYPDTLAENCYLDLEKRIKKYESDDSIKNIIIATHTIPTYKCVLVKDFDLIWNKLNGTFYNSHMEKLINQGKIKAY